MRSSKIALLGFLVFLLGPSVYADVKPDMNQMLAYIFELKPFIVSEAEYSDPANAPRIKATLDKMAILSEKINHDEKIKDAPKQISSQSLHQQFKDAAEIFERGNKGYSLWLLRSNLSNCMTCHTQLPARSNNFGEAQKNKYTTSDFNEAEFLFIIRNFDKALDLYSRGIADFPNNKMTIENIETARSRKIYYYTRVKRDLTALSASLDKDLKNKKLPPPTAQRFRDYSKSAVKVAKEKEPVLDDEKKIRAYAEEVLKNDLNGDIDYSDTDRNLRRLRLSGYLYEYIDKNPSSALRADIYYWLSFCESRWEKGPQDSLPEGYLRKCIQEFPKSPVAQKCYKEYEDLVTFGYTGSSGTHIPPEVSKELNKMKESVGLKK